MIKILVTVNDVGQIGAVAEGGNPLDHIVALELAVLKLKLNAVGMGQEQPRVLPVGLVPGIGRVRNG